MKFLVIGSNSFSGSQFIKYLLKEGCEVLGVSRSNQIDSVYLPYTWSGSNELFNFKQIDINKDIDKLISYVNEYKTEYIVNFAAQGMVAQSWKSPEDWYQTNVVAQVKLHDHLRKLSFLKK